MPRLLSLKTPNQAMASPQSQMAQPLTQGLWTLAFWMVRSWTAHRLTPSPQMGISLMRWLEMGPLWMARWPTPRHSSMRSQTHSHLTLNHWTLNHWTLSHWTPGLMTLVLHWSWWCCRLPMARGLKPRASGSVAR